MDIFLSLIVLSIIIVAVVNSLYSHLYKVVNMPSTPATRQIIIKDIRDNFGECDGLNIIDLGSGWGGLCHKLAKNFPKARIHGGEISPIPYAFSKTLDLLNLFHHSNIQRGDIFEIDLGPYDIIICYLSPYHMTKFEDRLSSIQHKRGCLLYSQGFPLANIKPDKTFDIPYSIEKTLYRYDLTGH